MMPAMESPVRTAAFFLVFSPTLSLAGGVVAGERLAVGVHTDGSLCDAEGTACVLYDPDGPEGPIPLGSDLLLPGRPFETWAVQYGGPGGARTLVAGGPDRVGAGAPLDWAPPGRVEDLAFVEGTAEWDDLDVRVAVDLPVHGDVFWITVDLTAKRSLSDVAVSRTVDADPDWFVNGSYGSAVQAEGAIASAGSRRDEARAIALAVDGGQARLCGGWCTRPDEVRAGDTGEDDGDRVIGVSTVPTDLAEGATLRVRFAYGLGATMAEARERAGAAMLVDDLDGDGLTEAEGDCDDRDPDTGPGASELPDGRDNDCDGSTDEDTVLSDDDGDGVAEIDGDCDDSDDRVKPGADPVEGVADADCDGLADDAAFRDGSQPDGWGESLDDGISSGCSATGVAPVSTWLLLAMGGLMSGLRRRRCAR